MKLAATFNPDRPVHYISDVTLPNEDMVKMEEFCTSIFNINVETIQLVYNKVNEYLSKHNNDIKFVFNCILRASIVRSSKIELYQQLIMHLATSYPIYFDSFRTMKWIKISSPLPTFVAEPIYAKIASFLLKDSNFATDEERNSFLQDFELDSFPHYIKYDMLENVQEISSAPVFEFEQTINFNNPATQEMYRSIVVDRESPLFYNISMSFTPLSLACFFGSLKCFKYFLLNGCSIPDQATLCAVHGNNTQIIHILEQKNQPFSQFCFEYAILNYHNEIADWLLLHFRCSIPTLSAIIPSFNIKAYNFVYLNTYILQQSTIMSTIQSNSQQQQSQPQSQPKELQPSKNNPIDDNLVELDIACQLGFLEIIKFIFENKKLFPDILTHFKTKKKLMQILSEHLSSVCQSGCFTAYEYIINQYAEYIDDIADFQFRNKKAKQAIFSATMSGSLKIINSLLELGFSPANEQYFANDPEDNLPYSFGASSYFTKQVNHFSTSIHLATELSNYEIVKLFLENDVDANSKDTMGRTPFHFACIRGNMEIANLLIKEGHCDIHINEMKGHTAFMYACMSNNVELQEFLLKNGFTLYDQDRYSSTSPLVIACENNRINTVNFLLSKGIDVNHIIKPFNRTALHFAAIKGHNEIVRILLKHHANPNIQAYQHLNRAVPFYFSTFHNLFSFYFDCY